jgi:hypothetical protein
MKEMKYYEFGVQRSELARWAEEEGLSVEGMIEWLKAKNSREYGLPVRFEIIDDDVDVQGYEREYRMRRAVKGKNYILTGIPIEFIERQARKNKMTIDQFMKEFKAVATYNNKNFITFRFRRWEK